MPAPVCRAAEGETVNLPWGRIVWTASRGLGNSTTMTFGRVTLRAGATTVRHRHPNCDEILHVLRGRIEHSLAGDSFTMHPGDTISIPTGIWHGARALGEDDAEVIICFSSADRQVEFAQE
jgi:quercetin dioxygenase-like cupin family protein